VRLYHQGLSLCGVGGLLAEPGDGWVGVQPRGFEALAPEGQGAHAGRRRLRRAIALDELWSRSLGPETLWNAIDLGNGETRRT